MHIEEFDYSVPADLIAQNPTSVRDASRLLVLGEDRTLVEDTFANLTRWLRPGDLLVLNNTQVIKARLFGEKDTGGQAEVLIERVESTHQALCLVRVSKPLRPGKILHVGKYKLSLVDREGQFYRLSFDAPVYEVLDACGQLPLPPYLEKSPTDSDLERYQTVFATHPGAVAAPTAGLHFSDTLLRALKDAGIETTTLTLHIGAGTFQPVRGRIEDHIMHTEYYELPQSAVDAIHATRARGGRIVAVGTTVVRTLESVAALTAGQLHATQGETQLFIQPGFRFQVVDALLTNFHLPKSTLLMLVCAFGGYEQVIAAYAHAVAARFRFFSYGDAMFLSSRHNPDPTHV